MDVASRVRMQAVQSRANATTLELFFDLVFVFALTQVTEFMAHDLTWRGMLHGLLILGILWWSWTGYAWLFNMVRADEGVVRAVLFAAMGAMFLIALTIPEAFDDGPGGFDGPIVLALCYFFFRLMHLALFWIIGRNDAGLRRQLIRFAPAMVGGTLLLLAASQLRGGPQTGMWALALLIDYGGTFIAGAAGWRLRSAQHFAERHGLILIVALGESIVAIGVGIAGLPISWPIATAAALGLTVAAVMWWAYFDVTALLAERALASEPEETRPKLARDAFSFLHLPLMLGIVLASLGLKKVLQYVSGGAQHGLGDALTGIGLFALYGGVALYLLAHVAFKLRAIRTFSVARFVTALVVLALIPVAWHVPALVALLILAGMLVLFIAVETVKYALERDLIRHSSEPSP
ncbi:MAG: low temperature requirement protein A [Mycobacteriales bacterium]